MLEKGRILNDTVQLPHRQLTNTELESLFIDLPDQIRDFYRGVRSKVEKVADLETETETAHVILAYLAGQRLGFRLGVALVAPQLAARMTDDELVDEFVRQLIVQKAG